MSEARLLLDPTSERHPAQRERLPRLPSLDGRTVGLLDINLFSTPLDLDAIGIRRLEVGGMAGAGLSMATGFGEIFAEARYYRAFSSLFDLPVLEGNVFNQSFGVNVGVHVPLRGKMPPRP